MDASSSQIQPNEQSVKHLVEAEKNLIDEELNDDEGEQHHEDINKDDNNKDDDSDGHADDDSDQHMRSPEPTAADVSVK